MRIRRKKTKKAAALALLTAAALLFSGMGPLPVKAADRLLTLEMAKKSGLANSSEYAKLESEIALKEASYTQAVKSVNLKMKNLTTFRWSPLLSFHFPEKPDLTEAYEFNFKPLEVMSQVDKVKHKLTDQELAVYENISNLYVSIVVKQDAVDFNTERLETMQETLNKNRLRLMLGEATQADIDRMEASVKALNNKIATDTGTVEANKKKLSKAIGMDVTTGYTFQNPYVSTTITRDSLDDLTQYTLDRDQNYYEVSMTATTSRISVETNYRLMEEQYGGTMGLISGYVNQSLSGQKIDGTAFKKSYDEFLEKVDEPWQGKKRILFVKIPKEWFKGEISGIRYVEDEPYALYEAALEYQDARLDQENEKDSLSQQVEDTFNNMTLMRSAYLSLVDDVETARQQLEKDAILNRLGELTYEEYEASQTEYEDVQNDMLDSLADFSQTLYSFDRLTCGGLSWLLEKQGSSLSAGGGGESYIEEELAGGAYYYIEPIISQQEFRLGVSIPDDFEVSITDFELWCDDTQIGERTDVQKTIRHLALAVDDVDTVKLRFYDGDTFVDDCEIDPEVTSGPLEIVSGFNTVEGAASREIGTFTSEVSTTTGLVSITLKPAATEEITEYRILNSDGKPLVGKDNIPIKQEFRYPALLENSIGELRIEFYGAGGRKKYDAHFDVPNRKLIREE